ncbi:hypothetical protein Tfer_1643 [Thermincola ferriacetica]|uniref:Uncharacterized protein n=2 Tax=Thermincola TaxID=278993 RepID=D5X8M4_THEPJ|nr:MULTISPECIES: hypothetical protein [Thermincola]ADG82900.1 hypothetical protein TherJR_2055 [Thermincola potens JR]KNZ69622.1 hypothetical protein Tfer_1643 [Thermincola ferriacetica]
MAGRRLASLRLERNHLIDEWKSKKGPESAKLLVRIMDLDDDIDREIDYLRKRNLKKFGSF